MSDGAGYTVFVGSHLAASDFMFFAPVCKLVVPHLVRGLPADISEEECVARVSWEVVFGTCMQAESDDFFWDYCMCLCLSPPS